MSAPTAAEVLLTIAEPTRLRILNCLAAAPLFVSDLQDVLDLPGLHSVTLPILFNAAGGKASLYGHSSGAVLALEVHVHVVAVDRDREKVRVSQK